jgi:hypothetical protein
VSSAFGFERASLVERSMIVGSCDGELILELEFSRVVMEAKCFLLVLRIPLCICTGKLS